MAKNTAQLTGDSSVGTWLDDPIGGPIMKDLLAQGGVRRSLAERFVAELLGPAGQAMLQRHGFDPVGSAV